MSTTQNHLKSESGERSDWVEVVRQQVESLRYGVVQIVVHDSRVTQIEKTERVRLEKPRSSVI
ncbi:MAG TPA: YezD family protein [Verrucomicrobiae bacterium]|nr:YezD family protein [Verrucomicrobiae bacterium]